jgi:hypothetical protein
MSQANQPACEAMCMTYTVLAVRKWLAVYSTIWTQCGVKLPCANFRGMTVMLKRPVNAAKVPRVGLPRCQATPFLGSGCNCMQDSHSFHMER